MGAICKTCGQDMATGASCIGPKILLGGAPFERERFQPEDGETNCADCGVAPGGLHHGLICDNEWCPCCGDQLMCCDCERRLILEGQQ